MQISEYLMDHCRESSFYNFATKLMYDNVGKVPYYINTSEYVPEGTCGFNKQVKLFAMVAIDNK